MDYLQTAIQLGMKHKYFRIFVEEGKFMDRLLGVYLKARNFGIDADVKAFIEQIRACTGDKSDENGIDWLPLTETEMKVLRLIGEGLTNQEIASRLSVQIDTVKKHLFNIYRKLDVKNRTQAVRKAEEIGLFLY